jgi:2-dehydro-3-deoxygalactonokinase
MSIALIGVDWGTSNLRAWGFDAAGLVVARADAASGISAVSDGDYARVLGDLIGGWIDRPVPILLGGMIGSRQGWREAPYLPCPAHPSGLAAQALRVETGLGPGWILPGVSCVDAAGVHDVMRGEEVQLLGAGIGDGIAVLPGTHSKWVRMERGAIDSFHTFMTGELFALLKGHSLLGRLMVEGGPADWPAFDSGVDRALANPALTALLFSVRTEGLFERIAPQSLADYLSGLLIGAELAAATAERGQPVTIIGEGALVDRYVRAMARAGLAAPRVVAGDDAASAGLWRIGEDIMKGHIMGGYRA